MDYILWWRLYRFVDPAFLEEAVLFLSENARLRCTRKLLSKVMASRVDCCRNLAELLRKPEISGGKERGGV